MRNPIQGQEERLKSIPHEMDTHARENDGYARTLTELYCSVATRLNITPNDGHGDNFNIRERIECVIDKRTVVLTGQDSREKFESPSMVRKHYYFLQTVLQ